MLKSVTCDLKLKKTKSYKRVPKKITAEKRIGEEGFSNSRPNIQAHQSNG